MPPPESTKSRHSKQLRPPDDNHTSTAMVNSSVDNLNKTNAKRTADDNWLNSNDIIKSSKTNQIVENENRNELKLSNSITNLSSDAVVIDDNLLQSITSAPTTTSPATHIIDAFSELDPLGTGKIRPYIDKKYFFQDLKNPPKKVLKDLSDRDGFSTSFPNGTKCTSEFVIFHDKSTMDDTVHKNIQETRKKSEQCEEFVTQFSSSAQIFSPNNNGTHGTPPNLFRTDNSMFIPFLICYSVY